MSVRSFEIIQDKLRAKLGDYTDYRMSRALGISQTQYSYLKKEARSCHLDTLIALSDIAERDLGMDAGEFWRLVKKTEGKK